jgi:hypothetical protein
MEAMTYRQGLLGAALGASLAVAHFVFDGPPDDGEQALIQVLCGAFVGCYWMIFISVGLLNGYARPIRWGGAVLGLFMIAVSLGHDQEQMTPYLALICGVGLGTLAGATLPLATFRLKARVERKCKMRRFALLLAYPSIHYHRDNPKSIVSNSDPLETRLLLQQQWGVAERNDLNALLEDLLAEDRLGQAVEVVRWAVTDSMISKAEGWAILERVGRRAQDLYASWDDFAAHDALAEHLLDSARQATQEKRGPWKPSTWPKA